VLAGGPAADLSASTLYPGGYPLLITPAYWFSSNPSTVYHGVMVINAVISALVLPLGYLTCRRLGLGRPAAYGVAFAAALVPAGFFYSEYARADAVFVVITLAWLLTTHSWLTASSARVRYANAAGSAGLAAYAYAVHSRGLVMVAGLAAIGVFIGWRQAAARLSVLVAALIAVLVAAAGSALNHRISLSQWATAGRYRSENRIQVTPASSASRSRCAPAGLRQLRPSGVVTRRLRLVELPLLRVRRGRGGHAPPAHARGQGARPAVRGHCGGGLGTAVAAARRSR
jgi:hypothetical protein